MVKGVIFDMDGVLVDTEWFYQTRREDFLRLMDFPSPPENGCFVGSNEKAIWEALVPGKPEFRQEMLMGYRAYRRLHPIPYEKLLNPQAPSVFVHLKLDGMKIGIASSSCADAVREMTKAAGIESLVDCIVSGEDCAAHKPDPAVYLRTLEALDLAPEDVIAVEDSPAGITAAKRAGLRVYALRPRAEMVLDQSAADAVIDNLTDVLELIWEPVGTR